MDILVSKRKRRTRRDYTMGFKSQIVAAVEKGDMTYKQAQKSQVPPAKPGAWFVNRSKRSS